jgi:hypothetical protein
MRQIMITFNTSSFEEPRFTQDRDRRTRANTPTGSTSHNEASLKNTAPDITGIVSQGSGQISAIGKVTRLEDARNKGISIRLEFPTLFA